MAASMKGLILGPMPVRQFLDEFLPQSQSRTRSGTRIPKFSKDLFAKAIADGIPENKMYKPYMEVITNNGFIPGFKMVNTSSNFDKDTIGYSIKPDPSMYREDLDVSEKVTQFGELELHSELKANNTDDAFVDPQGEDRSDFDFESQTRVSKASRGQLIHYATEWFARQHRRHAFTIFLFGTYVRFIRWDRAGAIVSEKFNFKSDCSFLVQFLWRFSHLDELGRGRDPYVRRATSREEEIAHRELEQWKPSVYRPVVVFTIPGEDGNERKFLAWGCFSEPRSLTGRCTRTYPVYEIATETKYLLKDGWRAHTLAPEAEILRDLREAKVEHVPVYICGGDVLDGGIGAVTKTDLYVTVEEADEGWQDTAEGESHEEAKQGDKAKGKSHDSTSKLDGFWKCGKKWWRVTQRFLHRFVSDVIGQPLKAFTSSKHMMLVVWHAFIACWQAYELCGIMHRDISGNNILITASGGILNDWDMAKKEADIQRSRRHERTGTWEFMSSLLLSGHHTAHTIQDDMESFVLVVIYYSLRYLPHNKTAKRTSSIIKNVFTHWERLSDDEYVGGEARMSLFLNNMYIGNDFRLSSSPLQRWVKLAMKAVKEWIVAEDAESNLGEGIEELKGIEELVEEQLATDRGVLTPVLPAATEPTPPTRLSVLATHDRLAKYFELCLQATDWPALEDDKPHDILSDAKPEDEFPHIGGKASLSKRNKPSGSGSRGRGSETRRLLQLGRSEKQSHTDTQLRQK